MKLSLNPGASIQSPSEAQVEAAIRSLPAADDAFAVLSRASETYIQTAGHPAVGFILEYRDGSAEQHFHCTLDSVSTDQVVAAFRSYLRDDNQFKSSLPWARGDSGASASTSPLLILIALTVVGGALIWFLLS